MSDADTGVGVGTPIPPAGTSPATDPAIVYRPPEVTALSLAEYAEIMGINPIQFMSGNSSGYFPSTGCTDRWRQYAWQDEAKTSRDELAREIGQAETDIAAQLGYMPGLTWEESEQIVYPKYYKRAWTTVLGTKVDGYYKTVRPKRGKMLLSGMRSVDLVASPSFVGGEIVLVDEDGDSFYETAKITVATTYTSPYEHKVYIADQDGRQEWEIRPVTTKSITGGTLEIRVPVWLLIRPELLAALPGEDGFTDIELVDTNYVASVDIYYETSDPSQGNLFHWNESTQMIDDTTHTTQLAALEGFATHRVSDEVSVTPATYDAVSGTFTNAAFTVAREPDYVTLTYQGGDYYEDVRRGMRIVPPDLAQAIAWMATARLSRPLCTACQNVKDKEERLRTDLAYSMDGKSGDVKFVTPNVLRNPFGTRLGEVDAWNIVKRRINEGEISAKVAVF